VLEHVRQRLLYDSVHDELLGGIELVTVEGDVGIDHEAARPGMFDELGEVGDTGWGAGRRRWSPRSPTQEYDHLPDRVEARPPHRLGSRQGLVSALRVHR